MSACETTKNTQNQPDPDSFFMWERVQHHDESDGNRPLGDNRYSACHSSASILVSLRNFDFVSQEDVDCADGGGERVRDLDQLWLASAQVPV